MDEVEAGWRRVLETGEPLLGVELTGETPAAPGRRRYWTEDWFPVVVNGRTIGVGAVVRETTVERQRDQLHRVLMGIVGHDLRNPLSVISMCLNVLLQDEQRAPRETAILVRAQRGVKSIAALARDLLDLTMVQRDATLPVTPDDVDFRDLARKAADEVEVAFPGAVLDAAGPSVQGRWDPQRLVQLLENLLSNAAKYGAAGQPIAMRWWTEEASLVVSVHDHGESIPADRLELLFEGATQRGDPATRRKGIGLGLFIARAIARAHGGSIAVESERERGTTFTVRLPVQPEPKG